MIFSREIRYYYLRFIRLRGEPDELALGMAFGVFAGMMPIMPFQIVFAVALAILFKGSKITAVLGTWSSNPLNWYFLYSYSYKIGAFILGLNKKDAVFSSIMTAVRSGEQPLIIVKTIIGSSTTLVSAFVLGGLVMGIVSAPPVYFLFLYIFKNIKIWRESRKARRP